MKWVYSKLHSMGFKARIAGYMLVALEPLCHGSEFSTARLKVSPVLRTVI